MICSKIGGEYVSSFKLLFDLFLPRPTFVLQKTLFRSNVSDLRFSL
jgi:hypothetical protein